MEAPQDENELNSLEDPGSTVAGGGSSTKSESGGSVINAPSGPAKKKSKFSPSRLISHLNIYLLLFVLILVLAVAVVFIGMQRNKKAAITPDLETQELTAEQLEQIKGSEAKVGDPKQTLSIESNAIFTGKVFVRDSLDVAGTIKVGGSLSLPGITVSGTSSFDQIQANKLAIAGDTNIQGLLTVQKNLTVTGGGNFGGPLSAPQLNVQILQINSDLQLNRHIDAGGGTPSLSSGGALGSGGTATVSGSDTAGTVAINVGGGAGAGCFATITFAQKYNGTPHVVITPVGPGAASIPYYINRSSTNFSICSIASTGAGSFAFDYLVID